MTNYQAIFHQASNQYFVRDTLTGKYDHGQMTAPQPYETYDVARARACQLNRESNADAWAKVDRLRRQASFREPTVAERIARGLFC